MFEFLAAILLLSVPPVVGYRTGKREVPLWLGLLITVIWLSPFLFALPTEERERVFGLIRFSIVLSLLFFLLGRANRPE